MSRLKVPSLENIANHGVDPIAMSVRSTNVYEEKSLGVFEDDDSSLDEEGFTPSGNRATIWSRYLAMHARKQLSFGTPAFSLSLFTLLTSCSRYVVAWPSIVPGVHHRGIFPASSTACRV